MIQKSVSIILLITIVSTTIGLELFQTARLLLKGEVIECVLESEENTKEENKSNEKYAKDFFEKIFYRQDKTSLFFASNIEDAHLSTDVLMRSHQNHIPTQDLPPEV
jgi:hypothetical protein